MHSFASPITTLLLSTITNLAYYIENIIKSVLLSFTQPTSGSPSKPNSGQTNFVEEESDGCMKLTLSVFSSLSYSSNCPGYQAPPYPQLSINQHLNLEPEYEINKLFCIDTDPISHRHVGREILLDLILQKSSKSIQNSVNDSYYLHLLNSNSTFNFGNLTA